MSAFTYTELGATTGAHLPARYHHLHHRTLVGTGPDAFDRAREAVVTFAMHRGAGARIGTDADRAAPGVRLTVTLGPFTVPCEVVYVLDEPDRGGFGYGTLPGHQESGEEAFHVERDAHGVWLRVVTFSRPARWPALLAGPIAEATQHGFAHLLSQSLRRICSVEA
jgi:uncharacterized protein (UPF0548 family)